MGTRLPLVLRAQKTTPETTMTIRIWRMSLPVAVRAVKQTEGNHPVERKEEREGDHFQ